MEREQIESFAHVRTDSFDRFYCFSFFLQVYMLHLKWIPMEIQNKKLSIEQKIEGEEKKKAMKKFFSDCHNYMTQSQPSTLL